MCAAYCETNRPVTNALLVGETDAVGAGVLTWALQWQGPIASCGEYTVIPPHG